MRGTREAAVVVSGVVTDIGLYSTSLSTMFEVLRAVGSHAGARTRQIALFTGLHEGTVRRALSSATALGLVETDHDGLFRARANEVTRAATNDVLSLVMKRSLLAFRPFASICQGLANDETVDQSVRRTCAIFGIADEDVSRVKAACEWAEELGLLTRCDGRLILAIESAGLVDASAPLLTEKDVASEAAARLYVAARLGEELYTTLDEGNLTLLVEALLNIDLNPITAVEKAGQVLENWLRALARAKGLTNAKKRNGASDLAVLLASEEVIHGHHQKLIDIVSTLRNAKAHHWDKKTLIPWSITNTAAVASVAATLAVIRSIHVYVATQAQML